MTAYRNIAAGPTTATPSASQNITVPTGVVSTDLVLVLVNVGTSSSRPVSVPGCSALPGCDGVVMGTFCAVTLLSGSGYNAGDTMTVSISGGTAIIGCVAVWYDGAVDHVATPDVKVNGTNPVSSPTVATDNNNEIAVAFYTSTSGSAKSVTAVSGTQRYASMLGGGSRNMATSVQDETVATAGTAPAMSTTISGVPAGTYTTIVSIENAVVASTSPKDRVAGVATVYAKKVRVAGASTAATLKVRVAGVGV